MARARILSSIGWVLISLWSRTIRMQFVNKSVPDRLASEGKNFIYAFWHGRQFLLFHSHRHTGVVINASESRDGEIQAGILKRFGFNVVRGSSKRKGERALLGLVDGLPLLDLDYSEDSRADVDFNVVGTDAGEFVEVQGTAEGKPFDRAAMDGLIDLASSGLERLFAAQAEILATVKR